MNEQIKYVKNLDSDIKKSLKWYTGDEYSSFNKKLRYGIKLDKEQNMHFDNINFAFENVPPLENIITVYKGVLNNIVYSDKAFMSTSRYYDNVLKFAKTYENCCVMEITVSKGSKILPLQKLSMYKDEEEILLDRDATLICTGKYLKKIKKEEDMNVLYCTYSKGYEIETIKDVKEAIKEYDIDAEETDIIKRILDNIDEEELEFYETDTEIKKYIESRFKEIYPKGKLEKHILQDIFNRIKNKY